MNDNPILSDDFAARFKRACEDFMTWPAEERYAFSRSLGILSKDNQLTKRFGGDGEFDEEAMRQNQRELDALKQANRRSVGG